MKMSPSFSLKRLTAAILSVLFLFPAHVSALPQGAEVRAGSVNIDSNAGRMDIRQHSQAAIVNWQSFSIGPNELVRLQQQSANSAMLARVLGADPSRLLGRLEGNGHLFLVNPNGVVVGPDGTIDMAGFAASTLDVADQDFLDGGDMAFAGDSQAGIVNLGLIRADNGDVILIGRTVENHGDIEAPQGVAALGAGNKVVLRPAGDQRIEVEAGLAGGGIGVENQGVLKAAQAELKAAGGDIYQLAVSQDGLVKTTGVERRNGRVILTADAGDIRIDGEVSAHNSDGAGGEVYIGGGRGGARNDIANAATVTAGESAHIDVAAKNAMGDGGTAIVWADDKTEFHGTIDGRAGAEGGDGAFVEVSGKKILDYRGHADLRAPRGETGTLLLDPDSAVISTGADNGTSVFNNTIVGTNLETANLTIFTPDGNGDISVLAPVAWSSANTLTLQSSQSVNVNAAVSAPAGGLTLQPGREGFAPSPLGDVNVQADVNVSAAVTVNTLSVQVNPSPQSPTGTNGVAYPAPAGSINITGAVTANTLNIDFSNGGFTDVSVSNSGSRIANLTATGVGPINGAFLVDNGSGNLAVSGDFSGIGGGATIVAGGGLTLNNGTAVGAFGDVTLAAKSGSFINNAGSGAVSSLGGRSLIYSDTPANTIVGGLVGNPVYSKTYGANPPASITQTGDRFLYSLAPTLTLTANSASRLEGDANPTFTYSVSGLVGGDTQAGAFSGSPSLSTSATVASAPGDYAINISQGGIALSDYGYQLSFAPGILTVGALPTPVLTITANDASRPYGENNPLFSASYSGFQAGDSEANVSGLQFSTAAVPGSAVGNYSITPHSATMLGYDISYVAGILTINPRDLEIRVDDLSRIYGDAAGYSATYTGLASFDTEAAIPNVSLGGPADIASNVGTYPIIVSAGSNPNYNISLVNGTETVTPRPITLSVTNQSRAYGEANPTLTYSISAGNLGGGTLPLGNISLGTTATAQSAVGDYPIEITADLPNFLATLEPGTLSISPFALSITADNKTKIYGDPNPNLTYSATALPAGHTLAEVVPDLRISTDTSQSSGVGTYPIFISGTGDNNYAVSFSNGLLTIDPAIITSIIPRASERLYGEADPAFELFVQGLKNGDTADVVTASVRSAATAFSYPGSYAVNVTSAAAGNYTIPASAYGSGVMNILPRPLTISADSLSREYGDPNPAFTATFDGLASFDTPADISGLQLSSQADISSGAGNWGIFATGASHPGYTITHQPGTLSITPAPLSVPAFDVVEVYGRRDILSQSVIPAVVDGLKGADTVNSLGLQVSSEFFTTRDVGVYPINYTLSNPNYFFPTAPGTLEIVPAPLSVQVVNQSRLYGDSNSAPSFSVTGLAYNDQASAVVRVINPTDERTSVGSYPLVPDLLSANYILTGNNSGNLTILKRQIALKPANVVRVYGDRSPAFETLVAGRDGLAPFHTADDLVADIQVVDLGGETLSASRLEALEMDDRTLAARARYLNVELANTSEVGNYVINREPGIFMILPRPIQVSVDDTVMLGTDPLPAFKAEATNLPDFETLDTIYPGLRFGLFANNQQATTQLPDTPATFQIPESLADATFFASYPSGASATQPNSCGDNCGDLLGGITPVEVRTPNVETGPLLTLSFVDFGQVNPVLLTSDEEGNATYYVQPQGLGNSNYAVTRVINGKLSIYQDPKIVAAKEVVARNKRNREDFLNMSMGDGANNIVAGSGGTPRGAYGMTKECLPVLLDVIVAGIQADAMELGGMEESPLYTAVMNAAGWDQKDGYRKEDLYAFLADIHSNPEKQVLLAPYLADYSMELLSKPAEELSPAQTAYLTEFSTHVERAADDIGQRLQASLDEHVSSGTFKAKGKLMAAMFTGDEIPYAELIGQVTSESVEMSMEGKVGLGVGLTSAAVAGGATAAVMSIGAVTSTIFPFASGMVGGASVATETIVISTSTTLSAVSTAAGPAAIVLAAVASGVIAAVNLSEQMKQKAEFDSIVTMGGELRKAAGEKGAVAAMNDFASGLDEENSAKRAIFLSAMASMILQ